MPTWQTLPVGAVAPGETGRGARQLLWMSQGLREPELSAPSPLLQVRQFLQPALPERAQSAPSLSARALGSHRPALPERAQSALLQLPVRRVLPPRALPEREQSAPLPFTKALMSHQPALPERGPLALLQLPVRNGGHWHSYNYRYGEYYPHGRCRNGRNRHRCRLPKH